MGAPGPSVGRLLAGRANRKEYWLWVAGLLAASFAMSSLPPAVNLVGVALVTCVQIRRLHDIGRTGWWAGAILLSQIPAALALYALWGDSETTYLVGDIIVAVPIACLGAIRGQPHENRFGPVPGKHPLRKVFS